MSREVWDASALLLLLHQEPGWEDLAPRLDGAVFSSVNLAEVATKLMAAGARTDEVREVLQALAVEVYDFTPGLAYEAAELRQVTRHKGLSLGDRACIALGRQVGLTILTADRAWRDLTLGVEIEVVR